MEIIPAIDIKDGACVRLFQGDYSQTTIYDQDPVEVAQRWANQGATRLHIVDLDGAKAGHPVNTHIIQAIARTIDIPVQLGGGMRTTKTIAQALDMGVARVILGTIATQDPALVQTLLTRFGSDHIIIGIDARDGYVATSGWTTSTRIQATELVATMATIGVQRIIYTDISRDGTLTEPNFTATVDLVRPNGPAIIASGGVADVSHITRFANTGVEGVIVGRALYTGAINLVDAMHAVSRI